MGFGWTYKQTDKQTEITTVNIYRQKKTSQNTENG